MLGKYRHLGQPYRSSFLRFFSQEVLAYENAVDDTVNIGCKSLKIRNTVVQTKARGNTLAKARNLSEFCCKKAHFTLVDEIVGGIFPRGNFFKLGFSNVLC